MRHTIHESEAVSRFIDEWKAYFIRYYDSVNFDEKIEESKNILDQISLDDAIISVSGGKDSLTLLHLTVNHIRGNVNVFHWDHGAALMPREVEDEILACIKAAAPKAKIIIRKYYVENMEARWNYQKWYKAFFGTLAELGYKYHVLGIRADESCRRKAKGIMVKKKRWVEVHPIFNWSWRDVWAYIFKHNIKIPSVYFKYAPAIGWEKTRLVTFFDQEFEKYGSPQIDSYLMFKHRNSLFEN